MRSIFFLMFTLLLLPCSGDPASRPDEQSSSRTSQSITDKYILNLKNEISKLRESNATMNEKLKINEALLDKLDKDIQEMYKEIGVIEKGLGNNISGEPKMTGQYGQLLIISAGLIPLILILSFIMLFRIKGRTVKNRKDLEVLFDFMNLFPRKNPYIVGSPVIEEELFFGRKDIIKKILNGIHRNHYYILGERRSGKTSLLKRLNNEIEKIDDHEYVYQPMSIDFQNITEKNLFRSLCLEFRKSVSILSHKFDFDEVAKLVDSEFGSLAEQAMNSDDFMDLFCRVNSAIGSQDKMLSNNKSIVFVLIIDEFDKINGFDITLKEEFRSIFMQREAVDHLRLIAAGGELQIWDRSSPFNFMIELHLSKLSKEDARQLIINPSRGVVAWDRNAVDRIIDISQDSPYMIQRFCSSVVDYALEKFIFKIDMSVLNKILAYQKGIRHE